MPEQSDQQTPDVMQLWREWLTLTERQFNAFCNEMLASETFARSAGGSIETFAAFQRLMTQGMERYLSFINVPSRSDIVSLAETLQAMESRLARIEETLQIAAAAVDNGAGTAPAPYEPRRTRRPPTQVAAAEDGRAKATEIPEELRR